MTRNATARTGLVPLWGRLFVSWYIDVLLDLDKVFWHLDNYDRENHNNPIVANDNLLFFVSLSDTSTTMPLNSFIESSHNDHDDYANANRNINFNTNINDNNNSSQDDIHNFILSSLNNSNNIKFNNS